MKTYTVKELSRLFHTKRVSIRCPKEDKMETTIYRLPCSLTGLDAEVDNCDPPAIIVAVKADDPMSAGCVDRYITTDGQIIDCSIDCADFAQWFELEELEEFEEEE